MTQTLCLHYAPDNASLCIRLALEALGAPYQTTLVDRCEKAHKSAAYLAMNPNGLIPVLETPDGPMFETGAILLWLSDRYGGLMPNVDAPGRAHAVQWLFWLSNTLHPTLRALFYPKQHGGGSGVFHRFTCDKLIGQYDMLEAAAHAAWLDQSAPSAHGCYLAPMLRWSHLYGGDDHWFDLSRWPRLLAFAQRADKWPATHVAIEAEGLGPTPFSRPQPCKPPEGFPT